MGFLMETDYQIRKLRPWSHHPRKLLQGRGSTVPGYRPKVRAPRPAVRRRIKELEARVDEFLAK